MPDLIDRREGRRLFGLNPEGYADARPPYPEEIYRFLVARGAIAPGTTTLEIGAGNGLATRRLIELGANPISVIEPDERFADVLRPGGYVALWWNVFGDPDREDTFHDATASLLSNLAVSPSGAPDKIPFALDRGARDADIARTGRVERNMTSPIYLARRKHP